MPITTLRGEAGITCVTVTGPMTIYNAADLKRELLCAIADAGAISLDLDGVDEMDTAGLQLLMLTCRDARAQGQAFGIGACGSCVAEVLERYNLTAALVPGGGAR